MRGRRGEEKGKRVQGTRCWMGGGGVESEDGG